MELVSSFQFVCVSVFSNNTWRVLSNEQSLIIFFLLNVKVLVKIPSSSVLLKVVTAESISAQESQKSLGGSFSHRPGSSQGERAGL